MLLRARARKVVSEPGLADATAFVRLVQFQARAGCTLSRLVAAHGRLWFAQDVLFTIERGAPRECFANAARLSMATPTLVYVEGFACTQTCPLAIHHAWVLDDAGRVLDPTWDDGVVYWGLPVAPVALCERLHAKGTFGLFDGPGTLEWVQRHLQAGTLLARATA